jgi:arylsulfatase A-like enzyme
VRATWARTRVALALAGLGFVAGACTRAPKEEPRPAAPSASVAPAAVSLASSASPQVPAGPPPDLNVILVTIDCLRADQPWAGYPRDVAPRLTAFSKEAVVYERAYSLSSYTSMSVGGLLAGRLPGELERDGYFFGTYAAKNLFFPELLQKANIRTMGAHAHGYFKNSGLEQGFDDWRIVPDLKWNNTTDENVTSPRLYEIVEKQLSSEELAARRFFLWVHFVDPHDQYMPHEGIGPYGKSTRDRYDAEVTFTDRWVGKLLDFVASKPWGARTAVIVSADHGEAFGEHKQYVHGFELWENLVRVPLMIRVPGAPPRRISTPRSAVDVAPTILDLFRLPPEPTFRGKSLVPELFGAEAEPRDVLLDLPQTSDNDRRRALVRGTKKLLTFGEKEYAQLFDLEADPGEEKPIVRGEDFGAMLSAYRAAVKDVKDVPPTKCREGCLGGAYAKARGEVK